MEELYLSNHKIDALPPAEGFNLTSLVVLNLDCNRIREIPGGVLGAMSKLKSLSLAHNHLEDLPATVSLLVDLHHLNLNHNEMEVRLGLRLAPLPGGHHRTGPCCGPIKPPCHPNKYMEPM